MNVPFPMLLDTKDYFNNFKGATFLSKEDLTGLPSGKIKHDSSSSVENYDIELPSLDVVENDRSFVEPEKTIRTLNQTYRHP